MNTLFLGARALHVIVAALWFGAVFLISFFLMPVLQQAGSEGGKIMTAMERRGMVAFMASTSGLTILTGLFLYWHLTGGFDPALSATLEAKVFGAGGVLGLASAIIGGSVVGRSAKRAAELSRQSEATSDAKARAVMAAEIQVLRKRMVTFGNLVVGLLLVTLILMSIGHYV